MAPIFKKLLFTIIFLCALGLLTAQKRGFHHGYIVEQSGDTLRGWVKDRSAEPFVSLYQKIRFKQEGKSRTRKYGPADIRGYGYDNQNFMAIRLREESSFFKFRYYTDASAPWVFLKVIERSDGLLYFEQPFVHDDNDYLDFIPLFYRPGRSDMVRVTQGILGFQKKRLAAYFADCPTLVKEINDPRSKIRKVWELYEFYMNHCGPK